MMPNDFDVISLFDLTGYAVERFTQLGYRTLTVDLLPRLKRGPQTAHWQLDLRREAEIVRDAGKRCRLLFGFPPCTDLAGSGALRFRSKRRRDPNFQRKALELFYVTVNLGVELGCPYLVENPVGYVSTHYRRPDYTFNPCDYGGYLPAYTPHPDFPDIIPDQDGYRKKTCLWTGNGFVMPEERPSRHFEIGGLAPQIALVGGKSEHTKMVRSASPRGFFIAVAETYHTLWRKG